MEHKLHEFSTPPIASSFVNDGINEISSTGRYEVCEENISPYQTYGQSCKTLSCNYAYGLVCDKNSICSCPSTNSYWSYNQTGCRRCPNGWSILNGKCIFVSTFYMNWTDASSYCQSFAAQLLAFTAIQLYKSLTLSQINTLVSSNTNYFLGLSKQPRDSGNWQWADGSSLLLSSMNLFCTNGSPSQFDSIFRTNMNCGMYRMDSCLARYTCQRADINFICEKTQFLNDTTKEKLVIYELEFNKTEDPNEKICDEAKVQ
ncbi:unnamed protein product [Rotaria socialis]|uniref:C-type lectin domain-containing protein n=1 Tax=Rotaria socialis TaxID=392032 RepID=A0A821FE37_9BILA|nr:unnamed protein product [Rotaria socialis]CAF4650528.1 unnamed protein product [Rotaria socialis]